MGHSWFTASREGLASTLSELERWRAVAEAYQNARDTDARNIAISLSKPKRGYSTLTVEDDDPTGFADLRHAYELFGDTRKRDDPTKAGRFTIGEKRLLALCKEATIESTNGTVIFEIVRGEERRREIRKKRTIGTLATFVIEMSDEQHASVCKAIRGIIPDDGKQILFNGQEIASRQATLTFNATLQTEYAEKKTRKMIRRPRETEVRLYDPLPGEKASIYELGIPVVETGDRWHVDVRQRVPLNSDRDNVTPSYLEAIRTLVANRAHKLLKPDEASHSWVVEALSSDKIEKSAWEDLEAKRLGEKKVVIDPSDPESAKKAFENGYTPIYGRTLTPGEFENNRRFETISSSSDLFPTPKPYSEGGVPAKTVPESEWTPGMKLVHDYTIALAKKLLGVPVNVRFVTSVDGKPTGFGAAFGRESGPGNMPQFDYFVNNMGKRFFAQGVTEDVDALIIHEFGHYYSGDHRSEDYYDALCKLGAILKQLALNDPDFFRRFKL